MATAKEGAPISFVPRKYLVGLGQERERESIRRLLEVGGPIATPLFGPLGLEVGFSWFLLEVKKNRLRKGALGDVDILAGRLEWERPEEFQRLFARTMICGGHPTRAAFFAALTLANSGGLKWPPPTDRFIAIEVKCGYLSPEADLISPKNFKSMKTSDQKVRHTRAQVEDLLKLGLDRVALLDVIANPPVSGPDGQAWLIAGIGDPVFLDTE